MSVISILLIFIGVVVSKMVIEENRIDTITADDIEREATKVLETVRNSSRCPGIQEKVNTYEFFVVSDDGVEERETAELVTEVTANTEQIFTNQKEPWIITIVTYRPDLNCMKSDDEKLIEILKKDYLEPPSTEEYNTTMIPEDKPHDYSAFGQDLFLDKYIFKGMKDGYFLEAGADDFVLDSNTLWFELEHNWTGVLVEANPIIFPKGFKANRKAWGAPFCLSTVDKPQFVTFSHQTVDGGMAGIIPSDDVANHREAYELQCFSVYSLLLALDKPTVNLFSLDIEGAEFEVLKSIPFDKVDIEVFLIELSHAGKVFPGTRHEVHMFLSEKGYKYVGTVVIDDIFIRSDLLETKYKLEYTVEQMEEEVENFYFNDDPNFSTDEVLDKIEPTTDTSVKDEL